MRGLGFRVEGLGGEGKDYFDLLLASIPALHIANCSLC